MSTHSVHSFLADEISLVRHDVISCALAQLLTKEYLSYDDLFKKVDKCLPAEMIGKEKFKEKLSLISRKGLATKVFVRDGSVGYTTSPLGKKILAFVGPNSQHLKRSHAKACQNLKARK